MNVSNNVILCYAYEGFIYFADDDDAMDQDSSDNSSVDLLSDSGLAEEDIVSGVEKFSLNVPSEVSIKKDFKCTT
jgi:hypothetical protein